MDRHERTTEKVLAELAAAHGLSDLLKQAENEFRGLNANLTSEEHYRLLSDAAPHLAWRSDNLGRVNDCNRRWFEYTGQSPDEAKGYGWMKAICPDDLPQVLERMLSIETGKEVYESEYRLWRALDGTYRWHLARSLPVKDINGKILHWLGSAIDISDRKQAEEALRESEQRFRVLFEHSPDAMFLTIPDGQIVAANPFACAMYGMTEEEICRAGRAGLLDADDPALEAAIEERSRTGRFINRVLTYVRKGGERFLGETSSVILPGAQAKAFVIVRDISERKQAEQALLTSEHFKKTVINTLPAHVAVLDRWGGIVAVNDAWLRFAHENDVSDLSRISVGSNYLNVCRAASNPCDPEAQQALAGIAAVLAGTRMRFELEYPCHSPTQQRWFLMTSSALPEEVGGAVICHVDITARKHAEVAMYDAAMQWQRTFDAVADALWVLGADQRIQRCNKAAQTLFAKQAEEMIGRTYSDIVHGMKQPISEPPMGRALDSNGREYTELTIGDRHYLMTIHPIYRDTGDFNGSVQVFSDITVRKFAEELRQKSHDELERHVSERTADLIESVNALQQEAYARQQAENALIQGEQRLDLALQSAASGVWDLNLRDGSVIWSRKTYELFGFDPEDPVTYTKIVAAIHPEDRDRVEGALKNAVNRREDWQDEFKLINPQHDLRWLLGFGRATYDAQNRPLRIVGIIRDVTEQKLSQIALRESELRFRQLAENVREAFWVIDAENHKLSYLSPVAAEITGISHGVLCRGLDEWLKIIHPEDLSRFESEFGGAIAGQPCEVDYRIIRPNGTVRWVRSRSRPVHDDNGRVFRIVGTSEDVTDRKSADEQQRQHQLDLAHVARLGVMGEMAASLAHELNQPLHAINNYARTGVRRLLKQAERDEKLVAVLEQISNEATRAGGVIRRIARFVQKRDLQIAETSINNLVEESILLSRMELEQRHVKVVMELAQGLPHVFVDSIQIEQVVLNLVRNAWEAMDETPGHHRLLTIRTTRHDGSNLRVEVRDQGIAIDQVPSEQIYEPFYTTKSDGMGMGLAISRSIIQAHGGRLWASLNEDKGCTFQFTLPYVQLD